MLGLELATPLPGMRLEKGISALASYHLFFLFLSLFVFQAPATALLVLEALKISV